MPVKTINKKKAAVSSLGRFCSVFGVVSTPTPTKSGYVSVRINGKNYNIHRLIADSFGLPKHPECTEVDHVDGNPSNNRLENLEWVTHAENVQRSHASNTRKSSAPKQAKPVRGRRVGTTTWTTYELGSGQVQRELGINCGGVSACCHGKQRQAGGYEFEFAEPTEPSLLPGEEWRATLGGAFVSSLGRFRSTRGVTRTPKPSSDGYVNVRICEKQYKIHRLLAEAFQLPKRSPDCTEVDHLDGDPQNNRVSNLEWVTPSENVQRSHANNNRKSCAPKLAKPVRGRRVGAAEWTSYPLGASEAARELDLNKMSVSACCNGTRKHTGGYEFQFDEPTEPDVLPGEVWREVDV
jgi:hypothetical protein